MLNATRAAPTVHCQVFGTLCHDDCIDALKFAQRDLSRALRLAATSCLPGPASPVSLSSSPFAGHPVHPETELALASTESSLCLQTLWKLLSTLWKSPGRLPGCWCAKKPGPCCLWLVAHQPRSCFFLTRAVDLHGSGELADRASGHRCGWMGGRSCRPCKCKCLLIEDK